MKRISFFILVSGIILFLLMYRWVDYREKELTDVLHAEEIIDVSYTYVPQGSDQFENTELGNPQALKELLGFLSQYKVKKTGLRDFESRYPEEQLNLHFIYTDGFATYSSLFERDVVLAGENQYKVINGPLDQEWVEEFKKKYLLGSNGQ
ncbi:hypothetical protein [Jeotgalibacillus campisalis]|uniref:Uncharacterized protein n=1 Tax=Jeotgalibacillus campisalis TaxID=220754 RepID=A0A0C2SGP7_9BACL|nr:hypothetical protein [Jeotgalibacillus campisalis]KIL53099.1 hypothetical protein KR50_04280 [Jeotgalibacillus campisalis]